MSKSLEQARRALKGGCSTDINTKLILKFVIPPGSTHFCGSALSDNIVMFHTERYGARPLVVHEARLRLL